MGDQETGRGVKMMNFFDIAHEDLFRPLTGVNKRRYMDILSLIWERCRRMPMYAIEKSTMISEVETYFNGLGETVEMEEEDGAGKDVPADNRNAATLFLRRLRNCGWLEEKEGEYEEEVRLAVNHRIVPLIKSFADVINPKIITYKGKLFEVFTMLEHIEEQKNPYETILKVVSEDMDELNLSLRQLTASIEEHIDRLTKGKKPEDILEFFEQYEERIVIGAYHRFKTNDNLFYYRTSLYEKLDFCEEGLLPTLVKDYMEVEHAMEGDARYAVIKLIRKIREDLGEMEEIMKTIDSRHILYRTRAVQRAQFQLLSDGSAKSKINGLLQYYAAQISDKDDLNEIDDTIPGRAFQIYGQNYFDHGSLATPYKSRKPTPIDFMEIVESLDPSVVEAEKKKLLDYARNALTSENVNQFAKTLVANGRAVSAGSVLEQDQESIVKIIGLYTYSQSKERVYDIVVKEQLVERAGVRFRDFMIEERKGHYGG